MNTIVETNSIGTGQVHQIFDSLDIRDRTRYEYKQRIKHFINFLEAEGLDLNSLLKYKKELASNESYSISTKNKYLACARIFLREAHRIGLLPRDITSNVKTFQQSRRHKVDGLDDDEAKSVYTWLVSNTDKRRECALISLLMFQGLRQAEVCNIKWSDLNLKSRTLEVLGKGRDDKERVYLHPKTVAYLQRYARVMQDKDELYLFTSLRAKSQCERLTERGLQQIVKKVLAELDIYKTVHGFRHYYTTQLIRLMPNELATVAQFTRHRSLDMLQIYNDDILREKDLAKFYKAFSFAKPR